MSSTKIIDLEFSISSPAARRVRAQLSLCCQGEAHQAVGRVQDLHRSGAMANLVKLYADMAESEPILEAA